MIRILTQKYLRIPLMLFLISISLAILSEMLILKSGVKRRDIQIFALTLQHKQKKLDHIMDGISTKLKSVPENFDVPMFELLKGNDDLLEKKGLSVLVTRLGEAVYWSDHVISFMPEIKSAQEGLLRLPNGWFLLTRKTVGPYVIHGLILIKYDYKIENNFLQNSFAKGFHLPNNYQVLFYSSEGSFPINSSAQKFLFSIKPSGGLPCIYSDLYVPATLYLAALFFFFMLIYRLNTHYLHRYSILKLFFLLGFLIGFYSLIIYSHFPRSVFLIDFFSPKQFAYSSFWPSMGGLSLFSVFIFFWAIIFFRTFNLPEKVKHTWPYRVPVMTICFLTVACAFVFVWYVMYILVMNSSVSFAVYQIEGLNLYSFLGFFIIGFLFFAFELFALRTVQVFRKDSGIKEFFIFLVVFSALLFFIFRKMIPDQGFIIVFFFFIILGAGYMVNQKGVLSHRLSVIVTFVFIFTFFTLLTLIPLIEKYEHKQQELMVVNLSNEHDPTAELYLRDIDAKLKTDTALYRLLVPPYNSVSDYISRKYFSGYFREYELQITVCGQSDSLRIYPQNEMASCFPFFDTMYDGLGDPITNLNFRYIENMNGRISYLGRYNIDSNNAPLRIYIELYSKLLSEGTGFPELLLPQHSIESRLRNHFSFAKYNEGELVDRGGDFLYALTSNTYRLQLNNKETNFRTWDGYEHCIYQLGNNSFVIVSRQKVDMYDYIISFPYLFVFFFIMAMAVNYATKPYIHTTGARRSLRVRIQFSIIGVVLFTLLIIGGGTIYYNVWQYQSNHQQDLIDKINSISIEVDMLMDQIDEINDEDLDFVNNDLVRISDIFWTDVNLYNLTGELLATSRPEIFEKGLISKQMDNTAIQYLSQYQPTRFLHQEHIGRMKYLSAYVPLIDKAGRNVGYINLPYFTHEQKFRRQIATFVLAFINIYVFLLMASILVAYYISIRITEPLKLIRENLSNMQLGKNTKPIVYKAEDEIGILVTEYNHKVEELAQSAEMLARNEREIAWREMAKQIAHEIKNPLTPMKLNIQFLQRSNPKTMEDYELKVKRVTETLIEQIDNLSAIATEFSNFAKIPTAKNEKFNLAQRLKEVIGLYVNTGQCELFTHFEEAEELMVNADKEQFSRAIINLVRNSIQSIPENVKGKISVSLYKEDTSAIISISDNGKGIDESLHEAIFMPSFTTKTSGAGLGLAITKNIVENFKGEIWYESTVGVGTTFFIKIPLTNNAS